MANLPTPNFTFDADAEGACIAGIRPRREGSYRLEGEILAERFVVHNYGHGGCGVSLSWGCANKVRATVQQYIAGSPAQSVAVIGAGVMGLTAATLLLDLGLPVKIYAKHSFDKTTSYKAGGQWSLSGIKRAGKTGELREILPFAYRTFVESIGKGFGVKRMSNYTSERTKNFDDIINLVPGLIPEPTYLRLPFEGHTTKGWRYETLLIEPPIFLGKLQMDLHARGVDVIEKAFNSPLDVFSKVADKVIINCTGYGAKNLWGDNSVTPVKGQLAMLPAQPNLQYLYGGNGYLFPRSDRVVIGGTFEEGVDNEDIDKDKCRELVDVIKGRFGKGPAVALSPDHIHHPGNIA